MDLEQKVRELGRFVSFGSPIAIDAARKLLSFLPQAQPEHIVDVPSDDVPSDEALGIRVSSY